MSAVMAPPFMVRCETELQVFFLSIANILSLSLYPKPQLFPDGGLYVHRSGATIFAGGLYVTKNGFTVHDGGALIRSKLNNLSFALNLKLKGSLVDLRNREVWVL